MPRTIIAGDAGTAYTNDTGKVLFQFHCDWRFSCGLCVSRDRQVGSYWPIPLHRRCRCTQAPVLPGATAEPFVDYRAKIHTVPKAQQAVIMGRANLTLVESGVVQWGDVVTTGRIRTLTEVVSRQKLTVAQMVRAGVHPRIATEAFEASQTGNHTRAEQQRIDAAAALLAQGFTASQVSRAAAGALAERVSIGTGPSGPSGIPALPLTTAPKPSTAVAAMKPKAKSTVAAPTADPRTVRVVARLLDAIRRIVLNLNLPTGDQQ